MQSWVQLLLPLLVPEVQVPLMKANGLLLVPVSLTLATVDVDY